MATKKAGAKPLSLDELKASINKKYGDNSFKSLAESNNADVEVIPTGLITLDAAIGAGGIPRGRITEFFGNEGCNKTGLALQIAGNVQKNGGNVVYIDVERGLDMGFAKMCGIDPDTLIYYEPTTAEEALDVLLKFVQSGQVDLVIFDSIAALLPQAENESEMDENTIALRARLMDKALRKMNPYVADSRTAVIFINQLRQNLAITYGGSSETTPGGKAVKFYASLRMDMRRAEQIKKGEEVIGNRVKIKIVKNKVGAPFKVVVLENLHGKGLTGDGLIIDAGLMSGVIVRAGAYYKYGEYSFMGKEKLREKMEQDPEFKKQLEDDIRAKYIDGSAKLEEDHSNDENTVNRDALASGEVQFAAEDENSEIDENS